ncbi:MAG: hypothetical protein JSV58_01850 [Candidatus Bathyarchaeota archaeon]|nr:MAG: hypothetical protein JSV58_01850 [Candidatus Bathyarchaeota archaeon]
MRKPYSNSERKHLESKLIDAFKDEMGTLSKEVQQIVADDLITAFQNRVAVFQRIQAKLRY